MIKTEKRCHDPTIMVIKMAKEDLLKLRKQVKRRKPAYTRHKSVQRKEVPSRWRKPRGKANKLRLGRRGHSKRVQIGYCSPGAVRGLNRLGLKEIIIENIVQLDNIKKESECIVISSRIGLKKKMEIIKKALAADIMIINWKDAKEYLKACEEKLKKEKDKKKEVKSKREEKKKTREKKAKEKKEEGLAEKVQSEEDKKEKEKQEKDKLLTKREM